MQQFSQAPSGVPVSPPNFGHSMLPHTATLDKLHWLTDDLPKFNVLAALGGAAVKPDEESDYYWNSLGYRLPGFGIVMIHWKPRRPKSMKYFALVQLNPAPYLTWDDFCELAVKFQPRFNSVRICRLDFAIDLEAEMFSLDSVLRAIDMGYVQCFEDYAEEEGGMYLGKGNKRLNIYSKNGKTRIEVQLSHEYCPVDTVMGMRRLVFYRPFVYAGVSFYDFDEDVLVSKVDPEFRKAESFEKFLRKKKKVLSVQRILAAKQCYERYGYARTRRYFNRQVNFARDSASLFVKHETLSPEFLDRVYRSYAVGFF